MLLGIYEDNINRIRAAQNVDPKLFDGLEQLLKHLAEQKQGVVSIKVKEVGGPENGKAAREDEIRKKYSLALMDGVGDRLSPAPPPDDTRQSASRLTTDAKRSGFNEAVFTVHHKNPTTSRSRPRNPLSRKGERRHRRSTTWRRTASPKKMLQRIEIDF